MADTTTTGPPVSVDVLIDGKRVGYIEGAENHAYVQVPELSVEHCWCPESLGAFPTRGAAAMAIKTKVENLAARSGTIGRL